ncbi:MAG: amino acid adenylation domain-containing protein [Actinomycetota bacterium]
MSPSSSGSPPPESTAPVRLRPRVVARHRLTRTQSLIWASQTLHPGVPLANMGKRARLRGAFDPTRLKQAFDAVVAHCEILRTVIDPDDRVAIVLDRAPATTEVIDLDVALLDRWCQERIATPIDARRGMFDSVVLQHGRHDHTWWLDLHHLATDAFSSALIYEATAAAYAAAGTETEMRAAVAHIVDPEFFSFVDGIEPPRRGTADERAAEWAADLATDPGHTPIAPYGPRAARTTEVDRVPLPIDASALRASIDGAYRSLSSELSMLTVAAMVAAVGIHHLDGRQRVRMGVPVHHRRTPAARRIVGPLMEIYPLIVDVRADEPGADMFRRVLRDLTTLLRRAVPGESPDVDVDVVVNVLTARYSDFGDVPAKSEWMRSGHVDATHPVRVQIYDYAGDDGELRWELDVNRALSVDESADRLPVHLGRVLAQLVESPGRRVGDIALAGADVQLTLLNPDPAPRPHDEPIHEQIARRLRADPAWIVAEHRGVPISAAAFDQRADQVARSLVAHGLTPGGRVGVALPRSIDVLVALHGVLRAGGAFVVLSPDDPPARRDVIAADAELVATIDDVEAFIRDHQPSADDAAVGLPEVALDDIAYVLYTSGSTGRPKGVPISHRGLADYLAFAVASYTDTDSDSPPVVAVHSSLAFDLTVTSLFVSFLSDGLAVIVDGEPITALGEVAADERITFLKATPSQLELLTRLATTQLDGLTTVIVGGEAFRVPLARRVADLATNARIFNEYGPTEAVVGCMLYEWNADDPDDVDVPIGAAAPGAELLVLDADGQLAVPGAWGSLAVRRPGMATEYLGLGGLSAERFVELPAPIVEMAGARSDGGVWYLTGDRVRVVRPGVLTYGGRSDDQLKVNGIRLEPGEVEVALVALDEVDGAIVGVWRTGDHGPVPHIQRCVRCGIGTDVPGVQLDGEQVCSTCRTYDEIVPQTARWFRTERDLAERLAAAQQAKRGDIDAIHLLSGGKDSTYALYQLVERGWKVHALTLDNGFISEGAKENVRRSVADLGITHEFATTSAMNEIFRDSLDRFSNVCNGCYKTIYTLAVARACKMGVPTIVTGLSRGQFFETRLVPHQFEEGRFDPEAIDDTVLEARRVYHHTPDAVTELLPEQRVFDDPSVLDEIEFVDFYRYVDVDLAELYDFLDHRAPWVRPADTGRSTNCLINVAGISVHQRERGFHNYAEPYSWDVRLGHKTRDEALEELDDEIDDAEVARMLATIGYTPKTEGVLTAWYTSSFLPDDEELDPGEIRARLRGVLPDHAIPTAFVRIDEMPLAASAKADTSALPPPTRLHRSGDGFVDPASPTEERICAVWCDVLGVDRVGATDDFFDLGGSSLPALETVAAIDAALGTNLPDAAVFTARTPRELAALVDDLGEDTTEAGNATIPDVDGAPLSPGEEAMLFEYRLDPADTRYNVTRWYRLYDAHDFTIERFRAAVELVVEAHGPLRTTFDAQRTVLSPDVAVSVTELDDIDSVDTFEAFAMAERSVPFDLDVGPLVRMHVARVGPQEWSILVATHHIAIDAGTFDVLWEQIAAAYADGSPPDLDTTYAAHAQWQADRDDDADRDYWLAQAAARPEPAQLRLAAPAARAADGYASRRVAVAPTVLTGTGQTPFATSLAASAIVLAAAADRTAIELGVTASAKDHPATGPLVGYYLNTLPIAVAIDADETFADVAARVARSIAEALPHRRHPYASIVRDARRAELPEPDVSWMLAYEQLTTPTFPGATVEQRILPSGTSVTDLTFFVQERSDSLQFGLEYRGDVLDDDTAEVLLEMFEAVLVDGARTPALTVGELVNRWRQPDLDGASHRSGIETDITAHGTVLAHFADRVAAAPECDAVLTTSGEQWSYEMLAARSAQIAQQLSDIRRGGRVGISIGRGADLIAAVYGVLASGATYVPLDPQAPHRRRSTIVAQTDLDAIVTNDDSFGLDHVVDVDALALPTPDETATLVATFVELAAGIRGDDVAYVIHTSGSTGEPRGVAVTHQNLAASTDARAGWYESAPARFLLTPSIGFDSSIVGLFWPLTTGGALVVPTDADVRDIDRLAALIDAHSVSHILMVPSLYGALLARAPQLLRGLHTAIVAGEASTSALVRSHHEHLPGVVLVNEYGPTEATVWSTAAVLDAATTDPVPIGAPIPGVTARLADPSGRPAIVGAAGELWIAGPTVASGYLDDVEATRARFVVAAGSRWYRTGDLVRLDLATGELAFVGRIDEQLNVGGLRVEPAEIEQQLRGLPGVAAAAVVAAGDLPALVAHVEMDEGVRLDEGELRTRLTDLLPAAAVPKRYVEQRALPRTSHGKVDRRALEKVVPAAHLERPPVAADHGPAAQMLHSWRRAFERSDIELDTDFFELGGDSITAVQLVTDVEEALGVPVPISILLAGSTPAGMLAGLGMSDTLQAASVDATMPPTDRDAYQSIVLRPGSPDGPIVVMTPAWDEVFGYQDLAEAFDDDVRVVALAYVQLPGSDLVTAVDDVIEHFLPMALDAIGDRQQVALVGWSFAGVVAIELADRLSASGVTVAATGMVDTFFPGEERHLWSNRWWKYKSMLHPDGLADIGRELGVMVRRRLLRIADRFGRRLLSWSGTTVPDAGPPRRSVGTFPTEAFAHRPGPIEVPVVLYRASTTNPARTIAHWSQRLPHLADVVVEGRHRGFDSIMATGRVEAIANDLAARR